MGFILNASMVRGELFKPSGKWMYTVAIDMSDYYYSDAEKSPIGKFLSTYDLVRAAFWNTDSKILGVRNANIEAFPGWHLFVPDPVCEHAFPVMITL